MKSNLDYVVECIIEAEVKSADGLKSCPASIGASMRIDAADGKVSPLEAAKQSIRECDKRRWLEGYLRTHAHWDGDSIRGATAKYRVRTRVWTKHLEERHQVGQFEFETEYTAGKGDR